MNGKTRDFCEAQTILNKKTRHSHKRDSANPIKMHTLVTSSSENHVNMHTQKSDAPKMTGCGLRPKAYRSKRTLGHSPYREKSDAPQMTGCGLRPKAYNTKRTLGPCPYREKYIQNMKLATAVSESERQNTRLL